MATFHLIAHPDRPPADPAFRFWVNVDIAAALAGSATASFCYCIGAPASRFAIPDAVAGERRDELWKTTCFEAFLGTEGSAGYTEWNFAPSGDWAAYDFVARRQGMARADVTALPHIRVEDNFTWWEIGATIAVAAGQDYRLGLSAVIEERDGTMSYWALSHPPGDPDFHHDDCFAARLA